MQAPGGPAAESPEARLARPPTPTLRRRKSAACDSPTTGAVEAPHDRLNDSPRSSAAPGRAPSSAPTERKWWRPGRVLRALALGYLVLNLVGPLNGLAEGSLIIGDSAIEIQEVSESPQSPQGQDAVAQPHHSQATSGPDPHHLPQSAAVVKLDEDTQNAALILGSAAGAEPVRQPEVELFGSKNKEAGPSRLPSGPLPPLASSASVDDITDGDPKSRHSHDVETVFPAPRPEAGEKTITGKVVDFELQPAGGHNKAKIKKKKKKKKEAAAEEEKHKKWAKKKKWEKKAMEKVEKKHMKKKKEEGKKKKKKWGLEVHGQKKKGKFKKKKWGHKVKKGKGVKKGKKGRKFLKDKGHKNSGFKTVYHKEEYGKSAKWHDIKREKKWDEESKKWKKKWDKEKGKKYKGDHMKKFEKKKKEGKKYKKAKEEKFKKMKKEKFEKGKKKKMEEQKKQKEGGMKKEEKKMKKMKKKKKKKP